MGSAYHAQSLVKSNIEPRLMISLEMIGYFSDDHNSQNYPIPLLEFFYPSVGNFIGIVGDLSLDSPARRMKKLFMESTNIEVRSFNAPSIIPGVDFSDHRNYWSKNIPAIMITDTAFHRNPNYHTPQDKHDSLNYKKMAEVVKGVFYYLSKLE